MWLALSHNKKYKLGIKSFSLVNTDKITLFDHLDAWTCIKQ